MPEITNVVGDEVDGVDGFIVNWEFTGYVEATARFRAIAQTAGRFPTTITDVEIVDMELLESGINKVYRVAVFVPIEGFLSAGITSPSEWMRDNFPDLFD